MKKTMRNNGPQQSSSSLGQKLVQNYICNTPKPQTLKQTILSFTTKNNSISALKKPGQSVNRQTSSNEGKPDGAPQILAKTVDNAQSSSYNNLMKNKQYESKTPQIKKYLIKRSDTDGIFNIN